MNTLTAVAALSLASSSFALSLEEIKAWKIQGEHQPGECATYAFHLNYKLSLAGVESQMIAYDWNKKSGHGHAIVIFSLNEQWYAIDNETDRPKKIKGDTDLERVKSFDRRAYQTREINFGSAKEYQTLADNIISSETTATK